MEENTQNLQKQLSDAKEQLNWLRQNFNEEINILIKENRELKEQLKSDNKATVDHASKPLQVSVEAPSVVVSPTLEKKVVKPIPSTKTTTPPPQAPPEISSIRWVLEWIVCKFKDWFIRLPFTIGLLLYHIFAIQYHKHLCNKR